MAVTILQVVLYCVLFTLLVAVSFRGNPLNIVYFYPKNVIEKVIELKLIDAETIKRKKKLFNMLFMVLMTGALLVIVVYWNKVTDFKNAFIQTNILLQAWNIYDGLVMDILWVKNSRNLIIKGTESIYQMPTVKEILRKRLLFIPILILVSLVLSGIIAIIG